MENSIEVKLRNFEFTAPIDFQELAQIILFNELEKEPTFLKEFEVCYLNQKIVLKTISGKYGEWLYNPGESVLGNFIGFNKFVAEFKKEYDKEVDDQFRLERPTF